MISQPENEMETEVSVPSCMQTVGGQTSIMDPRGAGIHETYQVEPIPHKTGSETTKQRAEDKSEDEERQGRLRAVDGEARP